LRGRGSAAVIVVLAEGGGGAAVVGGGLLLRGEHAEKRGEQTLFAGQDPVVDARVADAGCALRAPCCGEHTAVGDVGPAGGPRAAQPGGGRQTWLAGEHAACVFLLHVRVDADDADLSRLGTASAIGRGHRYLIDGQILGS